MPKNDIKVKFDANFEDCEFIVDAIEYKLAHVRALIEYAEKKGHENSLAINGRKLKVLEAALEVFKAPVVEALNSKAEEKAEAKRVATEAREAAKEAKAQEKAKETARKASEKATETKTKGAKRATLSDKIKETVRKQDAKAKAKA